MVRVCGGCREVHSAEVRVSCGLRCCPGCERRAAAERSARVAGAALRVPELVALRAPRVAAEVSQELAAAVSAREHWEGYRAAAQRRVEAHGRQRDRDAVEGHALRAARAEVRRARFRRWTTECEPRRLATWRWRLVTVSPRWNPRDGAEYSVEGLRARLVDLRARCETLWSDAMSIGGLAAATIRVELSAAGHVHAHVLYFGPFQRAEYLRRLAGCFVDIRELKVIAPDVKSMRDAVREATKYALKAPSPLRREWIAGESWRVTHPELAAAWVVATRDQQLVTHRGTMRAAMAAEDAVPSEPREGPEPSPLCRRCGREVCAIGEIWPIEHLAQVLNGAWWRERVEWVADSG